MRKLIFTRESYSQNGEDGITEKLIDIINEYFAIPIAKDKINFILLNDEDIDITAENKAPSAQTPKTQHNLLAIKHHTAHTK